MYLSRELLAGKRFQPLEVTRVAESCFDHLMSLMLSNHLLRRMVFHRLSVTRAVEE